jgi:hypothetical protein
MAETQLSGYSALLTNLATVTTTNTGTAFSLPAADSYAFQLDVGTITGTSPTFDTALQMSPDGGTTWYDWARFAQVTAAAQRRLILQPIQGRGEAGSEAANTSGGTGAINANVPMIANFGNVFRFKITVGGTSPSAATIKIWVVAAPRQIAV